MDEEITLDRLLSILENPTRRKILRKLTKETHYSLQLAKELNVSQQAIVKHLKILEENDLVESFEEKSTEGGPPRKCYVPTHQFSLRIDMGLNTFFTEMHILDKDEEEFVTDDKYPKLEHKLKKASNIEEPRDRLTKLTKLLYEINENIENIDNERNELLKLKEKTLRESYNIVNSICNNYEQRKILYCVINEPEISQIHISERLDLREKVVRDLFNELLKKRLIPVYDKNKIMVI